MKSVHFRTSESTFLRLSSNGRILLANLLQSSSSTFSCVSFPSVFAFQEGMWDTQISALLNSPTVSGRFVRLAFRSTWYFPAATLVLPLIGLSLASAKANRARWLLAWRSRGSWCSFEQPEINSLGHGLIPC